MRHYYSDKLQDYCESLIKEFDQIPEARKAKLQLLGDYIVTTQKEQEDTKLVFICTHNSRRSQFAQIWALAATQYYGIENIKTYSGGTKATAFNIRAINALKRAGFKVDIKENNSDNPKYLISDGGSFSSYPMFSKKFHDPFNPEREFCAVMTCSQADGACPFISGADERISIPYDDPREADGTNEEKGKYDERCRQIAREMFYVLDYVSNL